jgi:hypothetical protein
VSALLQTNNCGCEQSHSWRVPDSRSVRLHWKKKRREYVCLFRKPQMPHKILRHVFVL